MRVVPSPKEHECAHVCGAEAPQGSFGPAYGRPGVGHLVNHKHVTSHDALSSRQRRAHLHCATT